MRTHEAQRSQTDFHMWTVDVRKKSYRDAGHIGDQRAGSRGASRPQDVHPHLDQRSAFDGDVDTHKLGTTRPRSTAWPPMDVTLQARQGPAQSNVEVWLFSIHTPLEVKHTADESDVVMGDVVANTKGKRTIMLWGGDFTSTLQETSPGATEGSAGRRREGDEQGRTQQL